MAVRGAGVAPLQQRMQRATGYPYPRPEGSFLYDCATGEALPLPDWKEWAAGDGSRRTWVLACGSNAAPQQLARKFPADAFSGQRIPVVSCTLRGFDTVYSAGVTGYGSIPATLLPSEGALRLHATFLTEEQLDRMHATEGGYHYVLLHSLHLTLPNGEVLREAHTYTHKSGALLRDGSAVALREISCDGRVLQQAGQTEVLGHVASLLQLSGAEELVRVATEDAAARSEFNAVLKRGGRQVDERLFTLVRGC